MEQLSLTQTSTNRREITKPLLFTPAEWRKLLDGPVFLNGFGNSYAVPRRLMGRLVKIVPDHRIRD